ncbi:unnamed protein product [Lactuca saligna]|uniref:Uncharacterized protein n=1 Tax=Lactuca saligna TaxID=75948 RepID=A0AA35VLK5_LACSI|nr:unnamed protein product [Lactuca saligna]
MLRKLYDEEQIEEDKFEEEEKEDFVPIYDADGEREFCERINFLVEEEFIEEIEEETNFMIGDEFVETIVEEINFADMGKIVEEIVIFVEQQISFQELTTMRTNDYKCHKNSGSHIFYEYNFFSKDLKEIQIGSFIDQEGFGERRKHGEMLDFTNYDLNNDVFVLSLFIDQKEKKDLLITFDKKFCAIRDGDFSFVAQKQQDQLFLDDGRILYPPKDDMMISKKICVHGGSNQSPKEALSGNSYANFLCCPQTKHIFINSSFIFQKHQDRWHEVCWERKKKDGSSSWECTKVAFHPQMEDTVRIEYGELFELFEEEHVYVEKRPSWSKEKVTLCNKKLFSRLNVMEGSYEGTTQFGSY